MIQANTPEPDKSQFGIRVKRGHKGLAGRKT